VAPRISVNGDVRLDIEQEISNVPTTSANSLTPTCRSGGSRARSRWRPARRAAGRIDQEQQSGDRSAIPGLDQIPGARRCVRPSSNSTKRTELIIFIRPQIIRNGSDAHIVAEELRSKLRGDIATTTTNAAKTTSFR